MSQINTSLVYAIQIDLGKRQGSLLVTLVSDKRDEKVIKDLSKKIGKVIKEVFK